MIPSLAIFGLTYALISLQKIRGLHLDRPSGALIGAVLMILFQVVGLEEAYRLVDYNTLVLLLGMMILIGYLELACFFDWLSYHLLVHANRPLGLLWGLIFTSGFLSAFFVNDTICLVMTPLILKTLKRARLNPVPFLIALCTASNIGSAMTLTGNPQNMIIGIQSDWHYHQFFFRMLPISLISLVFNGLIVYLFYQKDFRERTGQGHFYMEKPVVDIWLALKTLGVLAGVFVSFVVTKNLPLTAITAGALIVLIAGKKPKLVFEKIDWTLFLFFAGLFVVIGGVAKSGAPQLFYDKLSPFLNGGTLRQVANFSLFSAAVSNLVSNVPFVLLAVHWIPNFSNPHLMWLVLAMSSTFAGNLTIMGSVANMIVMELSKDDVHVGFFEFFKVGFFVTAVSLAVGVSFLSLYAFYGW